MAEKKDWESLLKATEDDKAKLIKAYEMTIPQFDLMIDLYKKKISEFPAEKKEEMPDELKQDLQDILKP
jgi:uncharacterized protein